MYASFIIPVLVFAALLFHALQRLKTHLNGLAIGENAAYLLDVVISGIGYSFFNNLILWIGAVLALCTAGSVLAHMFIKNQNRSRLYWCIACMTIALLFPYLCSPHSLDLRKSGIQRASSALPRVAHAGGGYKGHAYTNSINALDANSSSYHLFELDFSWTSDGHLVCLHDWDVNFRHFFGLDLQGPVSLGRFQELAGQHQTFTKCVLESLIAWLDRNTHARIVTDVKEHNLRALRKIVALYPDYQDRFIPQVYQPGEYYLVRKMGYNDVILTLYAYYGTDQDVLLWLRHMDLYGLTMPRSRADRGLARRAREATGVLSWVHTINTREEYEHYLAKGADNIYTDWLAPPTSFILQPSPLQPCSPDP